MIKTFYTGDDGWFERQSPDGTTTFRSPSGHEYTTEPAGAAMYPSLATPTGTLDIPAATGPPDEHRGLAMPLRQRTRDQDRKARIDRERVRRAQLNAERAVANAAAEAEIAAAHPPPY